MLDLPVHAGVHHGGPIDADVVFIAELEEFVPVNYVSLSVLMEFGTPNRWMISMNKSTTYSDLILVSGQASIHVAVRPEWGDEGGHELVKLFHRNLMVPRVCIKEVEGFAPRG
jgi:hypothetical protein